MAKSPDRPRAPGRPKRDTGGRPSKDAEARGTAEPKPIRPTRAKAARPELPPIEPALADLLNPGIGQGTAGPGSQTGLRPPADNSFDRRADFSAAHRAR
jgi:excinuclease ABC subunit B